MLEYPRNLPLLSVEVTTRMKFSGVIQPHASGSEGRLSYWSEPLWEFDLAYNGLREGFWGDRAFDELSQIEGLFGKCAGTTTGFKYYHPRRNRVFRQSLGSTDGSTAAFDLVRTYGPPSNSALQGTEHIGLLYQVEVPFALYIDSSVTAVAPGDATYGYTLSTATPGKQQLVFNSAPAATHTLHADYGFHHYARFAESPLEYMKFAQNLFEMQKVTLCTLRAESL
jgi:hypothetical protein